MTSIVEQLNAAGRELQELEQRMASREADRAESLRAKWHEADMLGQSFKNGADGMFYEAVSEVCAKDDSTLYQLMLNDPQTFGVELAKRAKQYAYDVSMYKAQR